MHLSVFLSLCLFVVPSGPFPVSSVCSEWNDLCAAATFRPSWAHAGKNKMYSHDLTPPKPVTTGSNHRFITTPKREGRGGRGEERREGRGGRGEGEGGLTMREEREETEKLAHSKKR